MLHIVLFGLLGLVLGGEGRLLINNRHSWKNLNFISTVTPSKAEMDIRVAHGGILAMEIVVPALKEQGVFLREVTNGKTFLQVVYQGKDMIVDCDFVRDEDYINDFIRKFFALEESQKWEDQDLKSVVNRLHHGRNASFTELKEGEDLPDDVQDLVEFEMMKFECKALHKEMRKSLKESNKQHNPRNMNRNAGAVDLVDDDVEEEEDKKSDESKMSRAKRSMFIYPGTNWCGKGSMATNYYDLGLNIDTDKCCRAHDFCTVTIEGLSSNYNYFNYRLHTLSHCECDDQFHTCLKTSGDEVSEMVGKLFFNVIANKCFILGKTKVCTKRSWWGRCISYKKQSQAELRDPLGY